MSHTPVRREADTLDAHGDPLPFATPPEARLPAAGPGPGRTCGPGGQERPAVRAAVAAVPFGPARSAGARLPDRPGEPGTGAHAGAGARGRLRGRGRTGGDGDA